mgnify:CR=1 FL=1
MALPPGFRQVGVQPAQGAAPQTQQGLQMPAGFERVRSISAETPRDIREREALSTARGEAYATAPEGAFRTVLTDQDPAKAAAITAMAQFTPDPIELGNILTRIDPNIGIQVSRDDQGRDKVVAINRVTNKIISLNDPGLSMTDVGQITTAITAAIPAGRATTMGGRALAEAGIQSLIEGAQTAAGGEFNVAEPLMAGGFSMAADAIPMAYRGITTRNIPEQAKIPKGQEQAVSQTAEMVRTIGRSSEAAPTTQIQQAGRELIQPDPETVAAARSLGMTPGGVPLEESLPLGAVSQNPQYISLEAALAQAPGGVLKGQREQAIKDVASKADEFITRFGGDVDIASVDMEVKDQMIANVEGLRLQARGLYDQINDMVPGETPVDPSSIVDFLDAKIARLGDISDLSKEERRIYQRAMSDEIPFTYEFLDEQRQLIGKQKRAAKKGTIAPSKEGFKIGELEDALLDAQQQALASINPEAASIFDIARPLVAQRKELEKINQTLMGADLTKDILPNLRTGLTQLSSGKLQKFRQVMDALPPELRTRALVSAMNSAFTKGATTATQLTPNGFATWWEKLSRNKTAKAALLEYMPEGAPEYLEALATVSSGLARSLASVPPTGVTKAIGMFDTDGGFVAKILGMVPVAGSALASSISQAPVDTLETAANLMNDPTFKRTIFRAAQGQETTRLMDQLATKPVFKQWMQTLPEQTAARILSVGLANYLFGEDGQ